MIRRVTITNYLGDVLDLDIFRPDLSQGIYIKSISGLGPNKADIRRTEIASNDGALYNSARLPSRNIVFTLGFLFDPSVEDVRLRTYKFFPIKRRVTLTFYTDNRIGEIVGYVESNEPNIFSKEELTQISVVCPLPYFYSGGDNGVNVTVFSGIRDNFEFPFSNESLTENLIEFGIIMDATAQTVWYTGDADVGVLIVARVVGEVTHPVIRNTTTGQSMFINTDKLEAMTGKVLVYGDELMISTVQGDKYVRLLRDGRVINIINTLERNSEWIHLVRGDNIFAYIAETGTAFLQFRIENRILYEGV